MKSQKLEKLYRISEFTGKNIYLVGGAVRNEIANVRGSSDADVTGEATGEEFALSAEKAGVKVLAVYKHTGTCLMEIDGEKTEYTCFRKESYSGKSHVPDVVTFGATLEEDALRRDFRCNAVYKNVRTGEIADPLGGIADIKAKRLTTCRTPEETFGEDGLRLMRLVRFVAELGFFPDENTVRGAKENSAMINGISAERVFSELGATLTGDFKYLGGDPENVYKALTLMTDIGVLKEILPELYDGFHVKQPEKYHKYDVLTHTFKCVYYADKEVRLPALLHDIGKPYAFNLSGNFHGHEKYGADIAEQVLGRLKASKSVTERVKRLVAMHMEDSDTTEKENKVRLKIVRNDDIFDDLMKLKEADAKACKDETDKECPTVVKWKKIREDMINRHTPFKIKDLAVNGNDLALFGFKGEEIGRILNELFEECVRNPEMNDKSVLTRVIRKRANKNAR